MKFYKEITLKDGRKCVLKNPSAENATDIIEHMRITSGETDFMLRYPDEISFTEEREIAFLKNIEESADSVMVSAFVDGELAANGGLNPVIPLEKCRHRAEFGVSVKKAFWSLGIGSAILEAVIDCAKSAGYKQLELDVVAENERGLALYKKYGFAVYGKNEKAFKLRDGSYRALYLMSVEI